MNDKIHATKKRNMFSHIESIPTISLQYGKQNIGQFSI